jgi:putative ATPase
VSHRRFRELSAVTAGVKDVRAVIEDARLSLQRGGPRTVLFVDEVHRFSKTQQDALLPAVEQGWVTLVAATTENPSFSVIGPLISRCLLVTLQRLTEANLATLLERATSDPRGLGGSVGLEPEAGTAIVQLSGGDARKALTILEEAAGVAQTLGHAEICVADVENAVDKALARHDKDDHYDIASAFIKSIRGSDVDAALHWFARLIDAGEDPRFIARRLIISASEDIGIADWTSLTVAVAAAEALDRVGLPEARIMLGQAVIHLALAPKSNAVISAVGAALADVERGRGGVVPLHLRDSHYASAKGIGHGVGYRYPHDEAEGVVEQQYLPDDLRDARYYSPSQHGFEKGAADRLERLRSAVHGDEGKRKST